MLLTELLCFLTLGYSGGAVIEDTKKARKTMECEFFDSACANEGEEDSSCYETRNCYDQPEAELSQEAFCFTVWVNGTNMDTDPYKIKRQGCVFNHGGSQVSSIELDILL